MNKRDLLEMLQKNYQATLDTVDEWARSKGLTAAWGQKYRLVAATHYNLGWLREEYPWDDIAKMNALNFLNAVKVTGGTASIIADVKAVFPDGPALKDEHVQWTIDLMNNWDSQYFLKNIPPIKDLRARDTEDTEYWVSTTDAAVKGTKGDKGDQGLQGLPGPQGPIGPPGTGGAVVLNGTRNFENLGKDDSARTKWVNDYFRGGGRDTIVLPAREISTDTQLEMISWFSMVGGVGVPSREYGRCRWKYTGDQASIFKWFDNRGRHSYPDDGSPRDGNVIGVEFVGNKDVVPRSTQIAGQTLWYWLFHNCGGNGIKSFHQGYGNGTQYLTGVSHAQAFTDTLLDIGGSENTWFGGQHCFIDTKVLQAGKPELRSKMDKSFIEKVMTTTRGSYLALEIYGGHRLSVSRVSFDAQDGDPANTSAVVISGGTQIHFNDNTFKGMALGGQPIVDIRNGSQIVFTNNGWVRRGATNKVGPANTPLIKVGSAVGDGQVVIGETNTPGDYQGFVIAQRLSQVINNNHWVKVALG